LVADAFLKCEKAALDYRFREVYDGAVVRVASATGRFVWVWQRVRTPRSKWWKSNTALEQAREP
jgi:hypothetical protein